MGDRLHGHLTAALLEKLEKHSSTSYEHAREQVFWDQARLVNTVG